jgi:hypothetical protein
VRADARNSSRLSRKAADEGVADESALREELRVAIEAREELGDKMEPAVIDVSSHGSSNGSAIARTRRSAR